MKYNFGLDQAQASGSIFQEINGALLKLTTTRCTVSKAKFLSVNFIETQVQA